MMAIPGCQLDCIWDELHPVTRIKCHPFQIETDSVLIEIGTLVCEMMPWMQNAEPWGPDRGLSKNSRFPSSSPAPSDINHTAWTAPRWPGALSAAGVHRQPLRNHSGSTFSFWIPIGTQMTGGLYQAPCRALGDLLLTPLPPLCSRPPLS